MCTTPIARRALVLSFRRRRVPWAMVLAALVSLAAGETARAGPYIVLGPKDYFAMAQPYVQIELWDGTTSLGPGPEAGVNEFLLDTGANSILAVDAGAESLGSGYAVDGAFYETGVAGTVLLDVSAPYRLDFAGTNGVPVTIPATSDSVRILSSPHENFGYPWPLTPPGLVGMPAMVNRVTTLDLGSMMETGLGVAFHDTLPAGNGYRLSVSVDDRVSFDPHYGLAPDAPPDAPLPAWAPIPFLTATPEHQGVKRSGDFLFDTGAAMTVISERLAFALGLDEDGDGTFDGELIGVETVGGLGGLVDAPVLNLDRFHLLTDQGVDLIWTDLQVLVLDIAEGIDGVFGSDLLTSNDFGIDWITLEFTGDPFFQQVHFDFRDMLNGNGTIYFDVTPRFYQVVVPPALLGDANNDGVVDDADASILGSHWLQTVSGGFADGDFNTDGVVDDRDAAIMAAHWTQSVEPILGDANGDGVVDDEDASILGSHWLQPVSGGWGDGDFNTDGVVDDRDAAILAAHWGSGAEGNPAVPEPAAMTLLVAGLAMLAGQKLLRVGKPSRARQEAE
ncbi:MAG: dockerin type I domain-containing protein [Planctomycetia bacterium]|nr:dockerin type I domain-containing protein [Planctomycetia bacterium]